MMRATTAILPPDDQLTHAARAITLPREDRYRRRIAMTTDCGLEFLLDLGKATYLPDGSGLLLESGEIIKVRAAAEPLLEIRAEDRGLLMRIAWHIGNRHTPAEIAADALYIQPDHVLADMVRGLGGSVRDVVRPFEPEGGAYGGHAGLHGGHHGPDDDHGAPSHHHHHHHHHHD
jgi:urease accessory protein